MGRADFGEEILTERPPIRILGRTDLGEEILTERPSVRILGRADFGEEILTERRPARILGRADFGESEVRVIRFQRLNLGIIVICAVIYSRNTHACAIFWTKI